MAKFHWDAYIEECKDVRLSKPMFGGTRITLDLVFKATDAGTTQEEWMVEFPHLKLEHFRAAMLFAVAVLTMDS